MNTSSDKLNLRAKGMVALIALPALATLSWIAPEAPASPVSTDAKTVKLWGQTRLDTLQLQAIWKQVGIRQVLSVPYQRGNGDWELPAEWEQEEKIVVPKEQLNTVLNSLDRLPRPQTVFAPSARHLVVSISKDDGELKINTGDSQSDPSRFMALRFQTTPHFDAETKQPLIGLAPIEKVFSVIEANPDSNRVPPNPIHGIGQAHLSDAGKVDFYGTRNEMPESMLLNLGETADHYLLWFEQLPQAVN